MESRNELNSFRKVTEYLSERLPQYSKRGTTLVSQKKIKDGFLIYITYHNKTELNPYTQDIKFQILLTKQFPEFPPKIFCMTTFCFPTLFDHRDIFCSIFKRNWSHKKSLADFSNIIGEIISEIPKFISKIKENEESRILFFYGSYDVGCIYNVNDFLFNFNLDLYKIIYYSRKDKNFVKNRYILLTDLYLLLFDIADENHQNYGKLLLWGELNQVTKIKKIDEKDLSDNTIKRKIKISWKTKGKNISIVFSIENKDKTRTEMIKKIQMNADLLKAKFCIFSEDPNKPMSYKDYVKEGLKESADVQNLITLAKYLEELLAKNNSSNTISTLIDVYQKIIEGSCSNNDSVSNEYQEKLRKIISEKHVIEDIKKSNENKELFESTSSFD